MRQWRFLSTEMIDEKRVIKYVEKAIANAKLGKEVKSEKKKALELPAELTRAC
jgi:uncharacterized protein YdeI (YjbR/CyaY-like superfamily)